MDHGFGVEFVSSQLSRSFENRLIGYHRGQRWKCEAVQIGGPNSARGAVGTWFDECVHAFIDAFPSLVLTLSQGFGSGGAAWSYCFQERKGYFR